MLDILNKSGQGVRISTAVRHLMAVAVVLPMLLASACMLGPDFHTPDAPHVKGYTSKKLPAQTVSANAADGEAQRFIKGQDIPAQWWTLFHSKPLNRLVEQAIKSNPTLEAAQASLRQAEENVYAGEGVFFPSVDANLSAKQQLISGSQFGRPNGGGFKFALYFASVKVSYPLDFFGGARRQLESLKAQRTYEGFQLEAAYLTLTSNVVTTAVQEASLRAQMVATREIIKAESEQLNVLKRQFALGGSARGTVLTQRVELARTRASLPPLEKKLALVRHQLATLSGHFPGQNNNEIFNFSAMQLPHDLPVSLPSMLVRQRPDIRSVEAQLHEASARIGVATANFFPKISITGDYGSVTTKAGSLFSTGTGVWSLGGNLLQPILHGGTLIHQRRAAIAAYDKAAARYRSAVLSAFRNVADALRALQSDADTLKARTEVMRSASDSLDLSRQQLRIGAINYLSMLDAQRTYLQARISLVQSRADRYADTAALFQALGGGWWNRTDMAGVEQHVRNTEDGK